MIHSVIDDVERSGSTFKPCLVTVHRCRKAEFHVAADELGRTPAPGGHAEG